MMEHMCNISITIFAAVTNFNYNAGIRGYFSVNTTKHMRNLRRLLETGSRNVNFQNFKFIIYFLSVL